MYGLIVVTVIVLVILLFTLLPGEGNSEPLPKPAGRAALKNVPLIDGYNNLPAQLMEILQGAISSFPFDKNLVNETKYSWSEIDIPRLKEGYVGAQVFTIKVPCDAQYKDAAAKTMQQIDAISRLINKHKENFKQITSLNDINNAFKETQIGSILAIDGGHSLDNKLAVLRILQKLNVKIISLTSECSTPWAASYKESKDSKLILSDFGERVVKEMNRLGIVIDLAKTSTKTQLKVLEASKAPCIYSSAAAYDLYSNEKNIQSTVFDLIKKNKALVQISLDGNFIVDTKTTKTPSMKDVIKQINFFREKLGVDHIGIGSAFNTDGRLAVKDLEDSSKYPNLFDILANPENKGENDVVWTIDELEKLAGSNFQRVLKDVEQVRDEFTDGPIENLIPEDDIKENTCYTKKST